MLALLGLCTIVLLLAAILTKRMSPLVALIVIPVTAALIGGFGFETGKFVLSGLQNLAGVADDPEEQDRKHEHADDAG
jgi:citrate-Mg2+:H+ or citrate-Ca2+:H+ symporter, CitMHS family